MKRLFTFLPAVLMGSSLVAQEVVLTVDRHAFSTEVTNEMVLTQYVDPGSEGRNQVWDLSSMKPGDDFTGTITSSFETDFESRFPETNVVLNEFGNRFYFQMNDHELRGYGMTNRDGRTVHKYDKPYLKMRYPFGYGNFLSENYSGTVRISDREYPMDGTYEVVADGYGKLLLPDGSWHYPTLRVKTVQTYTLHFENPQEYDIITYRWYSSGERYPLAVLITSNITTSGRTVVTHKAAFKAVSMLTHEHSPVADPLERDVKVYPNPVEKHFTLEYKVENDTDVLIELYDNSGKKVTTLVEEMKVPGEYSHDFNVEKLNLTNGTYLVRSKIGPTTSTTGFIRL